MPTMCSTGMAARLAFCIRAPGLDGSGNFIHGEWAHGALAMICGDAAERRDPGGQVGAAGQHDPYFAPLAALAGVSPTVGRSLREGIQYVAGFALGAMLAIPVAVVLGPSIAGIAVIVLAGVVIAAGGDWAGRALRSPSRHCSCY